MKALIRTPLLMIFLAVVAAVVTPVACYNWWSEWRMRKDTEAVVGYQKEELQAKTDTITALLEDLKGRDKTISDQKAQLDAVTTDYEGFLNQMRKSSSALSNPALATSIQGSLARLRESDKKRLGGN